MKRSLFLIGILLIASNIFAQLDLPRLSPKATITQNFGYTTVTIEYSRPDVKGRKIWGELIPFEKVYRMGANEATIIDFSTDVTVNGNKVPAGKYALFSIPAKNDWTIILNKTSKQWGAFSYDEKQDLLRFQVKPIATSLTESLTYGFSDLTINSVSLNFAWEKLGFAFKIESDVMNTAHEKIKEAVSKAKPDDWRTYVGAANFAVENNWFMNEALSWADKAIENGGTFYVYFVKAKILFKMGDAKGALEFISKAREKGKDDKNFPNYSADIAELEKEIKAKL